MKKIIKYIIKAIAILFVASVLIWLILRVGDVMQQECEEFGCEEELL